MWCPGGFSMALGEAGVQLLVPGCRICPPEMSACVVLRVPAVGGRVWCPKGSAGADTLGLGGAFVSTEKAVVENGQP